MPASSFSGTDLYLRIHLAQREGLIDVVSEARPFESFPCLQCLNNAHVKTLQWDKPGIAKEPQVEHKNKICHHDSATQYLKLLRSPLPYVQVANLEGLFVQPMLEFYQSSGVSPVAREWNALRQAILREAVKKLVPQLQEETSNRLLNEAREAVVEAYSDQLWKFSSLPPVQVYLCFPNIADYNKTQPQ